ncbi:patatin-like phospholipase family protein [Suttonella ornithocola]|uniref:Patatin-like phospholipase n=1 Tax=Suttonella ornithocola TaxID=279832 RepID=A0A380MW90_9GAMM|nr:patatin-like phospholipase family protein [Suttonella ornithocola]SUO96835.1 Patatin-like phospholipase [Suttonella ornithocola]
MRIFHLILLLFLTACANTRFEPTVEIAHVNPKSGYRLENIFQNKKNDPLLVVISFSGGGSRAAAFGYAVLKALNKEHDGQNQSLLNHVSLTFGVSGGSVIAMHYALHGKETLKSFPNDFLHRDFEGTLINRLLSFTYRWHFSSPQYGRGDLLAHEFDQFIFHGATFQDLISHRKGPFAVIHATDLAIG